MTYLGAALALLLVGLLSAGLWWTWRRPALGLGLLVGGMAFHSFVLMVLLRLDTPGLLVRAVQGWKEALLAILTVVAIVRIGRARGRGLRSLTPTDWVAAALAVLTVVYFLIPESILHSGTSLGQRLVGFRVLALIPLLYLLGRTITLDSEKVRLTVLWLCVGAGAAVSIFGMVELFLVPTRVWLDWGVNLYSSWLGFSYGGPKGMPPNFFATLPDGTLLRRMVSTYISPLGVAYTALLLFPMAVVLVDHAPSRGPIKSLSIVALALVVLSLLFAVTRLALFAMVGEAALLWLLLRKPWLAALVPVLMIATALMLYPYASLGPAVDRNLVAVQRTHWQWAISGNDSSTQEHYGFLVADIKFDLRHPLGLGTGASIARFGNVVGTGESAVLGMFGDLGFLGGTLFLLFYVAALWHGYRAFRLARGDTVEKALPLVAFVGGLALAPVAVTSDVWGDLSVTFLFFWAAGASATFIAERSAQPERASHAVRPSPVRAGGLSS